MVELFPQSISSRRRSELGHIRAPTSKPASQTLLSVLQDYERLINIEEIHQIPMMRLITTAYRNALPRSELNEDYFFAFPVGGRLVTVNCNRSSQGTVKVFDEPGDIPTPRSVIDIDPRYLFGLLTGIYHWNNAGLGSQFNVRRTPNIYNIQAQRFLIFSPYNADRHG